MNFKRAYIYTFVIVLLSTSCFLFGYFLREFAVEKVDEFPILMQAYQILKENGYYEMPVRKNVEYGMIRGMIQAYDDPYTIFVEPIQHELEGNTLHGSYGGIGVELTYSSNGDVMLYPLQNSPALEAGVLEGDILIGVDDMSIEPSSDMNGVHALLRGEVGTQVKIKVRRLINNDTYEFNIGRIEFPLPSVSWHLDYEHPLIGIVRINIIAASTVEELIKSIDDLLSRGAYALILDLRDNYGGLLDKGIEASRLFLKNGLIINQQYRDQEIQPYSVEKPGPYHDIPIVILVNQNTASAAEIIAGSLQANNRAVLVGTQTMGKDTIQLLFELDDGSSIHVTTAKWWFENHRSSISGIGLEPDIIVNDTDQNEKSDQYMDSARAVLLKQAKP